MNMKQWIKDVIEAKEKKAIPVLSFPSIQLLGITVKELISDSDVQSDGMAAIAKCCPTGASVSLMDLSVEAECFGAEIQVSENEVPTVTGSIVNSMEDAENLKVPQVGAGRTGIYVESIKKALTKITDRPVFAGVIGPYSLAGRLQGLSEIMPNCFEFPDMVHLTLEKATEFLLSYILEYKKAGAHGVVMAEPAAGLLSPALCSEFSSEYVKKIVDAAQDENFLVIYHNCGPAVKKMVPELLETGAAAYHFGNAVSMPMMLEQMPSDVLVMGNVDPVKGFRQGTPESLREETMKLLEACSGYSNFVISSGCDIPPASRWENINEFFRTVTEFYQAG